MGVTPNSEAPANTITELHSTPTPALPTRGREEFETILTNIKSSIRPALAACGPAEIAALLRGLEGRRVAPGPSGAPTRGRLDVLPTGRNFYSVDNRAFPTPTAWDLGRKICRRTCCKRHFQDTGQHLKTAGAFRLGHGEHAHRRRRHRPGAGFHRRQAGLGHHQLARLGLRDHPLAKLGRPRVDVTLRISGFFRDAFPAQIELFDKAVRAVAALDEPEAENPIAARMRAEAKTLLRLGPHR